MARNVMTVAGPVEATELGHVQPHEHIFCDLSGIPNRWDLPVLSDEAQMIEEVQAYRDAGGGCIVDVTPIGVGRSPEKLSRVSKATGIHVVMGTAWYRQPYYPEFVDQTLTAQLAEMLIDDIENGAEGTGIRPGIIGEIGTDKPWMRGVEERVFRAAGRAHKKSGLAITTHTPPYAAEAMFTILREEGVDPNRIIFGHCDNTLELEYLEWILATSAYVEFDLLGIETINSDARRCAALCQLVRRGHLEKLLLSCDLYVRNRLVTNGGAGYAELLTSFLPRLAESGLGREEIEMMTRVNPQRVLSL